VESLRCHETPQRQHIQRCLPDSPKPDLPKLGIRVRVRLGLGFMVRVGISANRVSAKLVSANRDWTNTAPGYWYNVSGVVPIIYYWFRIRKEQVTVFMHFWLAFCYSCCLFSVRYRCIWGVSVNTTSAPSATSLCRLPQPLARNWPSMYSFFAQ